MPIPVVSTPLLSFEQANPYLAARQHIAQSRALEEQQRLLAEQAQQEAIKSQYLPQTMAEQLKVMQAQTAGEQAKTAYQEEQTKWYAPKTQSEIAQQRAQAGLFSAEAEKTRTLLPAELAWQQIQTKYYPFEQLVKAQQAINTGAKYGPVNQFTRLIGTMPQEEGAAFRSSNVAPWGQLLSNVGNQALQQGATPPNALTSAIDQYFPQTPVTPSQSQQQALTSPLAQATQPQGAPPQQQVLTSPLAQATQPQQPTVRFAPQPAEQAQLVSENVANNAAITTQMRGRKDSAVALEKWLMDNRNDYVPRLNSAMDYAGATGKLKMAKDAVLASSGKAPQGYIDYKWAIDTFRPSGVNQIKMMEKMGATNEQRKEMQGLLSAIDSMTLDPKGAKKLFNESVKTLGDLSEAIISTSEPHYQGVTRKLYNIPKLEGNYLDLKPMAKQTGARVAPSKQEWLSVAKKHPRNANLSDKELNDYYDKKYGGKK